MGVLRDIFRRKGRSALTIAGIAIGVFALVVLGAVAENNNVYVDRLTGYYEGVVTVIDEQDTSFVGMASGERPLLMDIKPKLDAYPGVTEAYPVVSSLIEDDYFSVIPPVVIAVSPGMWSDYLNVKPTAGRLIDGAQRGEVVLGSDIARGRGLAVGDVMTIRGIRFTVAGILDRTFVNVSDSAAYVPLRDAQQLFWLTLPKAFQDSVKPEDLAVQYSVGVEKGADPDAIAREIARDFPDTKATGPTESMESVDALVGLLNAVVFTISGIALLVCTLSVVNTMTMAVGERTREIGVKRALGASRWRVAGDVVAESALMGALGGAIGLAFGALTVLALNSALVAATGTSALLLTWRLAGTALVLSVALGVLGGSWPARHAAKLDPATALAYE